MVLRTRLTLGLDGKSEAGGSSFNVVYCMALVALSSSVGIESIAFIVGDARGRDEIMKPVKEIKGGVFFTMSYAEGERGCVNMSRPKLL